MGRNGEVADFPVSSHGEDTGKSATSATRQEKVSNVAEVGRDVTGCHGLVADVMVKLA